MDVTPSFISLLENLSISNTLQDDLHLLKIKVNNTNIEKLKDVIRPDLFTMLFDCLITDDGIQISITCDILERMLMAVDPKNLYESYESQFVEGLLHPDTKFYRAVRCNPTAQYYSRFSVLKPIVYRIADQEIGVAREASNILIPIAKLNFEAIFSPEMLAYIQEVMAYSETDAYRFYEMFLEMLANENEGAPGYRRLHGLLMSSGSASPLHGLKVDLTQDADDLLLLNSLELCTSIADLPQGFEYLQREGYISLIEQKLEIYKKENLEYTINAILKFYGRVSLHRPGLIADPWANRVAAIVYSLALATPSLLQTPPVYPAPETSDFDEMKKVRSEQPTFPLQTRAMQTLGCAMRSVSGKRLVPEIIMKGVLHVICQLLIFIREELVRISILEVLNNIFTVRDKCDKEDEISANTELLGKWYSSLKISAVPLATYLQTIVMQPFPEQHEKILILMATLSVYPWGRRALLGAPGWPEYIVSRNSEHTHADKKLKFSVVRSFLEHHKQQINSGDEADHQFITKLEVYAARGAFFIIPEPVVNTESL